ncbi:hypothetical protein [Allomuricauda sp. SCSIO 65647]|uniref:hypothetical protein n=1 Tax=Allomuricauda sp. SCSIO 65647 TaxID=2908843 RepID=UPI001F3EF75B|nr:hypothetical protein [Muricauda sp. SCSIO 65647]UJH68186.1 hypothetical protein L0P89_03015 [Muricauda sp. SCSIO 65647]
MKKCLEQVNLVKVLMGCTALMLVLFTSCSEDGSSSLEEDVNSEEVISATELNYSDEAELISEEVSGIAEDVYATDEIAATSKFDYSSDFLPDCVTITTVVTDTTKEKTIDFGEGCELPNGNVLGGIIYLSYEKDMDAATKTLELALENFTFNGVAIEGGADILRERANADGNPQSVANASFNATWPDETTASFEGTRTREWIEGYGSGFWGDNVFLITGKGTYTGRLGNVFTKEVIVPLRREMSCRFIVSGVLEISRNDATASLDFGDGSCDAKGILTHADGTSEEIFLRRFWKN